MSSEPTLNHLEHPSLAPPCRALEVPMAVVNLRSTCRSKFDGDPGTNVGGVLPLSACNTDTNASVFSFSS